MNGQADGGRGFRRMWRAALGGGAEEGKKGGRKRGGKKGSNSEQCEVQVENLKVESLVRRRSTCRSGA